MSPLSGPIKLQTAIPCVNYDDFLSWTLPHNLPFLESVTVVTSPRDPATIQLAKQLGVQLFITDAWHHGGAFNKAAALNQWITHASALEPEAWLMTLDADILLFQSVTDCLDSLNPSCLYSVPRRICLAAVSLGGLLSGKKLLSDFPLAVIPFSDGKLWGTVDATNPAGLVGYLQLWSPRSSVGLKHFPETGTAEGCDLLFGLSFPDDARKFLPLLEVLHIGPTEVNWSGRRSLRWTKQS